MNKWLVSITGMAVAAGAMAVDSANIVGYIDKEAEADVYTPVTVMMAGIGGSSLPISSITFDGIQRFDSLQIFGNDGNVATELTMMRNGWEDDNGDDASDWAFEPGDSFWVNPANGENISVRFAGEVSDEDLTIVAPADVYTPFGNGTAKPVAIEDVTFDGIARFDSLQIFGNDGNVETELTMMRNGWEDDNGDDASDWVFQPGDSFWINPVNGDDITVTFPAAI